jgi:hypothetical protein
VTKGPNRDGSVCLTSYSARMAARVDSMSVSVACAMKDCSQAFLAGARET